MQNRCMTLGGSNNAVLHITATASEAEVFDEIARRTPHICDMHSGGLHDLAELAIAIVYSAKILAYLYSFHFSN